MNKGFWIVALFVCSIAGAQTTPPKQPYDHFKFWKVISTPLTQVKLLNQFDNGAWWDASVDSIEFIGNPTSKIHEKTTVKIANPDLHLVAYSITPAKAQPSRLVNIENQFTSRVAGGNIERWTIGEPELLLVPAGKEFVPTSAKKPGSGDHYVCYGVINGTKFSEPVTLEDQFDVRAKKVEEIEELEPVYFCVPSQKRHGRVAEQPLLDAKTHLAIYKITPIDRLPLLRGQFRVNTADQFGSRRLTVTSSRMLAVPTQKWAWEWAVTQ